MVRDRSRKLSEEGAALSEKFWRISLYVTDDTIAQIYVCDEKFSQIEGNGRKFGHIQ